METETTVTADRPRYVGRFAPSPTGALHLGSLLAAVGSYVDARANGGRWLLRIEDIDTPRVVPGSADNILRTLELFGLQWDGPVEYQSRRMERYAAALSELRNRGLAYECSCTRREIGGSEEGGYRGACRKGPNRPGPTSVRFRLEDTKVVCFQDRIQGQCCEPLNTMGDVVIRRRDGLYAYQLAVVVDDHDQAVTDIVRGSDLLPSTAWQIEIRSALEFPAVSHAHLPLLVESDGSKLAKSKHSVPIDAARAGPLIVQVLKFLRMQPPADLEPKPATALAWAISNWRLDNLRKVLAVPLLL
jgi:glutamyl-Q tRNA(Asp) synthetase